MTYAEFLATLHLRYDLEAKVKAEPDREVRRGIRAAIERLLHEEELYEIVADPLRDTVDA